ncbi:CLUMA_CG014113, isoform A [Clunio marinus]|uniref:Large ribosomal subunit protein uL18m n=1 Tax=Clunio marinus TaxID=568069 RepID=A0A1J1IP57_9DIPT|nr:CLUMA_CG014113, isoform A [Clunio marinus]
MTLPRKWPVNPGILRKLKKSISPSEGEKYLVNRNPCNLEFMSIASKPEGYKLDKPGRKFWNKITLVQSGKHVTAQMIHFEKGPVIEVSTKEWAIKKQLYKTSDTSAYYNLARVFAQRCLESGFCEMACNMKPKEGGKVDLFLKTIIDGGIFLREPSTIHPVIMNRYVGQKQKPYELKKIN